jgi:hypothetical protein
MLAIIECRLQGKFDIVQMLIHLGMRTTRKARLAQKAAQRGPALPTLPPEFNDYLSPADSAAKKVWNIATAARNRMLRRAASAG